MLSLHHLGAYRAPNEIPREGHDLSMERPYGLFDERLSTFRHLGSMLVSVKISIILYSRYLTPNVDLSHRALVQGLR